MVTNKLRSLAWPRPFTQGLVGGVGGGGEKEGSDDSEQASISQ